MGASFAELGDYNFRDFEFSFDLPQERLMLFKLPGETTLADGESADLVAKLCAPPVKSFRCFDYHFLKFFGGGEGLRRGRMRENGRRRWLRHDSLLGLGLG